ncbi:DUF2975 domain-containing protein [Planococcus beigongshangi]|uniref:DUF2975 domain-containing protein n=1 Tax=Planococcus beigongshangi TaxID=2782536 RepID=UPI001EED75CD|nr:DUF2975 domain-containing protein [Planococcus beigongshangi]
MTIRRASTIFLKAVLLFVAGVALALCVFGLPGMAAMDAKLHPETAYLQYPFLIAAYIFFTPFFIALYQMFKLLTLIDRGQAFSDAAVKALKAIRHCAFAIIAFIALGELATIVLIRGEDITHIITIGGIITIGSAAVALFASLLQKLVRDAIRMKAENELIV